MKMKAIVETRSKRARRSLRREPAETNHIEKQDNDHSNTKQESPQNLRREPAETNHIEKQNNDYSNTKQESPQKPPQRARRN